MQYPNGQKSSFSLGTIKRINNDIIQHKCSTEFGSSGSPILNLSNYKVIGVHKLGTKLNFNEGISIKYIIEEFNKFNHNILEKNKNNIKNSEVNNCNSNLIIKNIHKIDNSNNNKKNILHILDNNKINNNKKEENNTINSDVINNIKYNMRTYGGKSNNIIRIIREFKDIEQNPLLNLSMQASLLDKNNIFEWKCAMIGASDSSYAGGLFYFKVLFPKNYPERGPKVIFITPIYHVNVNAKTNYNCPLGIIDISTLNLWKPTTTIREVFCDIFLVINYLGNPNCSFSMEIAYEMNNNRILFEKKAKYFTEKYASLWKYHKEYEYWDFTYIDP